MGRLAGKVAFITGTGGGQGRVAAQMFANEGAHVIGCDIKEAGSAETLEHVRRAGGRMDAFGPVDLSDPDSASEWIAMGLEASDGRMDILYNNAGAVKMAFLGEATFEDWSFTIRNELDLIFNTTNAAWPTFVEQGSGAIINTASVAGLRGYGGIGQLAHSASKGGVLALTKQLAAEGAPLGIRANSISPGTIMTPALLALAEDQIAGIHKMQPMGRAGKPEDVIYCALYLASDEANWVTGADFVIDGGLTSIMR